MDQNYHCITNTIPCSKLSYKPDVQFDKKKLPSKPVRVLVDSLYKRVNKGKKGFLRKGSV